MVPVESAELLLCGIASDLHFARTPGLPAHVTLLYPFVEDAHLVVGLAHRVQLRLSEVQPFDCTFSSIGRFDDPPTALYLEPTPVEPFCAMIHALSDEFPEYKPYGGAFAGVIPHLTLVESADTNLWARIEERVEPALPLRTRVHEFAICRETDAGWVEAFRLPIGEARGPW